MSLLAFGIRSILLFGALAFTAGAYLVFGRVGCGIWLLAAGAFTILDQIPRRIPR